MLLQPVDEQRFVVFLKHLQPLSGEESSLLSCIGTTNRCRLTEIHQIKLAAGLRAIVVLLLDCFFLRLVFWLCMFDERPWGQKESCCTAELGFRAGSCDLSNWLAASKGRSLYNAAFANAFDTSLNKATFKCHLLKIPTKILTRRPL